MGNRLLGFGVEGFIKILPFGKQVLHFLKDIFPNQSGLFSGMI